MKVSAAIFIKNDSVLLMRRAGGQPCAGEWEFPGGKFENNESGQQCLQRELQEELKINAIIGDLVAVIKHTTDSGKVIELYAYLVAGYDGEITLCVHDKMEWVKIQDLQRHEMLPADKKISEILLNNKN